jgi:hypothetical protein
MPPPISKTVVSNAPLNTKTGWADLVASSRPPHPGPSPVSLQKNVEDENFWDSVTTKPPTLGNSGVKSSSPSRSAKGGRSTNETNPGPKRQQCPAVGFSRSDANVSRPLPNDTTARVGRVSDEFIKWSTDGLQALTGDPSQDSAFVDYLASVRSADEIKEILSQNLGNSDKASAFADEFLRRLDFEQSSEPADCGGGGSSSSARGRKRGRRRQAAKVDPTLVLGFTSSSSRIMQGTIETPELK